MVLTQTRERDRPEYLRFPAKLRFKFERELERSSPRTGKGNSFEAIFEKTLDTYSLHLKRTIKQVFDFDDPAIRWFQQSGVDLVTWHYKTRHLHGAEEDREWLADQVAFNSSFKTAVSKGSLLPYESESPYIEIFAKEQLEKTDKMVSPLTILLTENKSDAPPKWKSEALVVPRSVTEVLTKWPEDLWQNTGLTGVHVDRVNKADTQFIHKLKGWMVRAGGGRVDDVRALTNLLATLKVTLRLLRQKEYRCHLPRSTFLCPAYVGGEKVGGMAFACRNFIPWEAAIVGEEVSTSILTYLRLREDALSHGIVEEMNKLDQAKRFFMHRLVHDFRHPVDALQATVRELRASLTSIEKQMGHINRVMDQTLFALEGRDPKTFLKAKKRPDKVHEFLGDLRYYFRRQFDEQGKKLEFGVINTAWKFHIDRGMLREAMENLVSNALEHGGDTVKIDVEKDGEKYLIHVRDNGSGIPSRDKDRIFRPYNKRSLLLKGERPRGRGLAIVKMLIEEALGGKIYVRTQEGEYYKSDGSRWASAVPSEWNADFVVEIPEK